MEPLAAPTADALHNSDSVSNRRAVDRCSCRDWRLVRLLARPSFQCHPAFVYELSRCGLGLIFTRSFEAGTLLAVQLCKQHTGLSDILTAQVRHSRALHDGHWHLGCHLSRKLAEDELYAMLVGEAPDIACWGKVPRNYRRG